MRKIVFGSAIVLAGLTRSAFAQYDGECRPLPAPGFVMAPQPASSSCLQARYAQQAQLAREQAQREAEARATQAIEAARIAQEQQIQRALVAAQIAAEVSPDNTCRNPSVAGMLIKNYNSLPWGYPTREAIDIEHLVTIPDANGTVICHGVFVHTNNAKIEGTLTYKPNVAGDMIVHWTQESWQPAPVYTAPAYTLPPALAPASVPVIPSPSATSTAFQQGLADRQTWEMWYGSINGDYRSGAYFWTTQRSLPHPQPCSILGGEAETGCTAAQARLAPSDARRKSEPEYRMGWNSFVAS